MKIMKIWPIAPLALSLFLGCQPEAPSQAPRQQPKSNGNSGLRIDVDVPGKEGDVRVDVDVQKSPDKEKPVERDEPLKNDRNDQGG